MDRFDPCGTDECKKRCDSYGVACDDIMADEIDRLRAELAECKRDAERYRFLRAHWDHLATNTCYENGEYHVIAIDLLEQRNIPLNLETLDAEIDAALAAKGEGK